MVRARLRKQNGNSPLIHEKCPKLYEKDARSSGKCGEACDHGCRCQDGQVALGLEGGKKILGIFIL
jgi:hypothetical protein